MEPETVQSRVIRLGRRPPALGMLRSLALFLAILLAAGTSLYGAGHSSSPMLAQSQFEVERSHVDAMTDGDHRVLCDDERQARDDGSCCVSVSGCSFCVPVTMDLLAISSRSEPAPIALVPVSLPGDVTMQLRPPKLVVTA